jgi:hypothetical protein
MTVRSVTFSKVRGPTGGIDAVIMQWTGMQNGDTGTAVKRPDLVDRSIQAEGTFGAGGSVTLEGSNDSSFGVGDGSASGGNFRGLTRPDGNAIALVGGGGANQNISQVQEAASWIRPHVTAGDGTTSLTVTVCARRSLRGG